MRSQLLIRQIGIGEDHKVEEELFGGGVLVFLFLVWGGRGWGTYLSIILWGPGTFCLCGGGGVSEKLLRRGGDDGGGVVDGAGGCAKGGAKGDVVRLRMEEVVTGVVVRETYVGDHVDDCALW